MRRAMIVCHSQTEAFSCLRMLDGAGGECGATQAAAGKARITHALGGYASVQPI